MRPFRRWAAHKALNAAFQIVDADMLREATLASDSSGSTAVVALRMDCCIAVAHVGDSRAMLCQRDVTNSSAPGATLLPPAIVKPPLCSQHASATSNTNVIRRLYLIVLIYSVPAGNAVRLTDDHTPGRPNEQSRILAAGGRVTGGTAGGLIVSRMLHQAPICNMIEAFCVHVPVCLSQVVWHLYVLGC